MTAVLRRSGSKLSRILSRAADPGALASRAQLYAKTVSAVAHLFSRSSGGIIQKLTGPAAILPTKYVDGLLTSWTSVSTVTVAAGAARSDDDTFDIILAGSVVANIANVGVVNGLDAGAEAADTWYAIWVIGDSTGVNAAGSLLSASFSAPTLPAGYDKKRRVGAVRNISTSDFARFYVRWPGRTRRTYFDRNQILALSGGNAVAFTSVSLVAFVPSTARNILIEWRFSPGAAGALADMGQLRPAGANSADGPFQLRRGVTLNATAERLVCEIPCSSVQTVEYKVTQAANALTLVVLGWDDEI